MTGLAKLGTCEPASPVLTGRPETRSRHASRRQRFSPIKEQGQNRRQSWPSRAGGHNAPSPVSRPCRPLRLSDRRYATDRDLTREMPLVVPRDQRNHFLPPVMTTVFPSGYGGRGFRLQPRHLEYRLYGLAILVKPRWKRGSVQFRRFHCMDGRDNRDFQMREIPGFRLSPE